MQRLYLCGAMKEISTMSLTTLVSARSDCVMRSALSIRIKSVARAAALLCLLGFAANQGYSEEVLLGDPSLTAGVPGHGPISIVEIETWLDDEKNFVELTPQLPLGLSQGSSQITGLDENPLTRAKIELGRQLYFDTRLSVDSTVSCASCHDPSMGYTAQTKTGIGIKGQAGGRNSPVSFNRILSDKQFWDGRAESLEAQAIGPIENPIEMGFTHEGVVKRLASIPVYAKQFKKIFGLVTKIGRAHV